MGYVLIVDDLAMVRELMDCGLRSAGLETQCVTDGRQALAAIKARAPDLMLLDLKMPVMDGLQVLEQLRAEPATAKLPVILLTGSGDRADILRAARFGVTDYLLKSHFSLKDLLARVRKHLDPPAKLPAETAAAIPVSATPNAVSQLTAPSEASASPEGRRVDAPPRAAPAEPSPPLKREETIERVEKYAASKTLAGVVAEVIAMAGSPRASMGDLIGLLKRDAVICARVMQMANTTAFTSEKPSISTIEEAVRNIGLSGVRNIAISVGFFDALPPDAADGFNAIRCWQHSFAVAALTERLAPTSATFTSGMAYLVGLCHDLSEIVLRQCLSTEYAAAVEQAADTGAPLQQTLSANLGIPWRQLTELVLNRLGLPAGICSPILEHADASLKARGAAPRSHAAQALRLADSYAHGLLLASSPQATVAPATLADLRALGTSVLPEIDGQALRCEVLSNTSLLARLSRPDEERLTQPFFPARPVRIWYARHPGYASFDPLGSALGLLAQTQTYDRLPMNGGELEGYGAMIVVAARPGLAPFPLAATAAHTSAAGRTIPVLYLTSAQPDSSAVPDSAHVTHATYPVPIARLSAFVEAAAESGPARVAA
jgi:CheY-like chemotaxis protein/HD-like signal output (HDOD) protein